MPAAAANATTTGQNKTGAYEITAPDNQQTGPLALRFLTRRAKAGGYCILSAGCLALALSFALFFKTAHM
jgi:hypothetical protein